MRCDSTHSYLSRETLSRLPSSTSSVDTRVDEVRSKGKGSRCPSCDECAEDCSCRRHILCLEANVKELRKSAREKKREEVSGWKKMEQRLEKQAISVGNLRPAGCTGPGPAPASHSALTSSAACNSLKLSTEIAQVHTCESHARSSIAVESWDFMSYLRSLINCQISDFDFFFQW